MNPSMTDWDYCIDFEQLNIFVDAPENLDPELRHHIALHLENCADCQHSRAAIGAIEDQLAKRPAIIFDEGFEERFRTDLMARMVTAPEVREVRRVYSLQRLSLAAAVLMTCSVALWALIGAEGDEYDRQAERESAQSSQFADKRPVLDPKSQCQEQLTRVLDRQRQSPMDDKKIVELTQRLRREFGAASLNLDAQLLSRLDFMGELDPAVLAFLPQLSPSEVLLGARAYLTASHASARGRREFVDLVVQCCHQELPKQTTQFLRRELDRGLGLDQVLIALRGMNSPDSKRALKDICLSRGLDEPAVVAAALKEVPGDEITELFFRVYLDGEQSGKLQAALLARPGVLARARSQAFARHGNLEVIRRAVDLLGHLGDRESAQDLVRMLGSQALEEEVVAALGRIGGPISMTELARRLDLGLKNYHDTNLARYRLLARHIASFGDDGARYFLNRAQNSSDGFANHYILAAGLCGTSRVTIHGIAALTNRDDTKVTAVRAINMIGSESAQEVLGKLCKSRDHKLRSAARKALELRRRKSKKSEKPRSKALVLNDVDKLRAQLLLA